MKSTKVTKQGISLTFRGGAGIRDCMIRPNENEFVALARQYDVVPVWQEMLADVETPVSVLQRLSDRENVFLLESMEGGETWGRYSFLGVDPKMILEVDHAEDPSGGLQKLRETYRGLKVADADGLPRFFGGAVGFLGYEAISEFEKMPRPKPATRQRRLCSRFLQADTVIVFDNVRHTIKVVVSARTTGRDARVVYRETLARLDQVIQLMKAPVAADPAAHYPAAQFRSNQTREQYEDMVRRAKKYIYAGDIIQAVLSQRFTAETQIPPVQLYRALRFLNPSPYTFFLKIGAQTLVGSSPEVMVRLTGNRVELRPIAGTRRRGGTEQEDHKLADELLGDEKEKAEHVMLVDLGRNDIGRIAEAGSVQVTEFMVVERYSHVMHLVSHVQGILRAGLDAYDVIRATFPAGTLSGAPKIRAMQIIHELEPEPRGAYGGAVGYLGYDGNMDLAITIRTLEVEGGTVSVQAGAGVVYDSDPAREYEETCQKSRGMQEAVHMAARGLDLEKS